jgi:hypothetical protein
MKALGAALLGTCLLAVAGCDWGSASNDGPKPMTSASVPAAAGLPSRPSVASPDVVAKVNDTLISKQDVELFLQELKAALKARGQTWTPLSAKEQPNQYDLTDVVNDMIIGELRMQEVLARGVDRDTGVQQRFWYLYRNFFSQEWLGWQRERLAVSDAEVEQYYNQYQAGFRDPEQLRVRQMVLPSEDQAKSALVQLLEGMDFEALAGSMSLRPDAAKSPLVDKWVMRAADKAIIAPNDENIRDLKDSALEQAAFAVTTPGAFSSIVQGPDKNYHVFQLIERRPGRQKALAEVSEMIRTGLTIQKLAGLTEELQKNAKIERFPERLERIAQ